MNPQKLVASPELQLAELYINTVINNIGKTRTHHPSEEDIETAKQGAIKEVEQIIGKRLGTL